MLRTLLNALKLFLRGRLFRDPVAVLRQWAIGVGISVAALVAMAKLGVPVALAIGIAALGGGALQPVLFKDLKFN